MIKALVIKEFYQIIRDPSTILISVILPLLLMFLFGFGISLDLNHLRLGIVMEDSSPDAQALVQSFKDSRYFDTKIVRHRQEVLSDVMEGNLRGFIVIPSYFTQFKKSGHIAPIQVIADGSEPNTANFLYNYVQGTVQRQNLIQVEPRFWFNEQLESRHFLIPGSLAIIMTLIGTLLTALVVAREWERGTMEALLATPVGVWDIVLGKLIPYFILGILSMIICVFIASVFYGVPLRGSLVVLLLVTVIFLICALGTGLLISTLAKNQVVASQMAIVSGFLPSYMLSGFLFEISSMPTYIQLITYLIPARYFVQCLQTLFLVGNVWPLILTNMIPMLIYAALIYTLIAKKTTKRLQ